MLLRFSLGVALSCAALILAGCARETGTENRPSSNGKEAVSQPDKKTTKGDDKKDRKETAKPGEHQVVTLHVKDMTERMKLV